MKRIPLGASFLGPVILLAVAATVRADDKTRQELLKAFEELRNDVQMSLPNIKVRTVSTDAPKAKGVAHEVPADEVRAGMAKVHAVKPKVGGEEVPTTNMIKVWAELDASGKKVALTAYEWKANERFYLVVETATPVRFALHYRDPKKQDLVEVLPDPEDMKTLDAVLPGKPYKLPFLLTTEDTDDDETVVLSIVQIGSPPDPPVDIKNDNRITFKGSGGVKDYCDRMDSLAKDLRANNQKLRAVGVETGGPKTSTKPDDVAIIAVGSDNSGSLEIALRKVR